MTNIKEEKSNKYIVRFGNHEGIDTIKLSVKQIDRPNDSDDVEVIREYILSNYGYKDYEIIDIDILEDIIL